MKLKFKVFFLTVIISIALPNIVVKAFNLSDIVFKFNIQDMIYTWNFDGVEYVGHQRNLFENVKTESKIKKITQITYKYDTINFVSSLIDQIKEFNQNGLKTYELFYEESRSEGFIEKYYFYDTLNRIETINSNDSKHILSDCINYEYDSSGKLVKSAFESNLSEKGFLNFHDINNFYHYSNNRLDMIVSYRDNNPCPDTLKFYYQDSRIILYTSYYLDCKYPGFYSSTYGFDKNNNLVFDGNRLSLYHDMYGNLKPDSTYFFESFKYIYNDLNELIQVNDYFDSNIVSEKTIIDYDTKGNIESVNILSDPNFTCEFTLIRKYEFYYNQNNSNGNKLLFLIKKYVYSQDKIYNIYFHYYNYEFY